MRSYRFYKISPGGNATVLIVDRVQAGHRATLARKLMDARHVQAEQVGYLDLGARPVRLDMMGGEFCGNACRAAAAVMAAEGIGLDSVGIEEFRGILSVSGVDGTLEVGVRGVGPEMECRVEMPLPETDDAVRELAPGVGLVRLPGIVHLCLDETRHLFPEKYAEASAQLRREWSLDTEAAVGCVWYRQHGACSHIRPVVWVRSTATAYYESGCGSGSLALGLWLGKGQNIPSPLRVVQPSGGEIRVKMDGAGALVSRAWISGPVTLVARGETWA